MIQAKLIPGNEDLTECFRIREKVFIEEQGCPRETEFDGKDLYSLHALVYSDGTPVATARLWFHDGETLRVGRVAVVKEMRGKGIGDLLLRLMLYQVQNIDCPKLIVHARTDAEGFYKKYGFKPVGEVFEEDGSPHICMELPREEIQLSHQCTGCGACGKPEH